MEPREITWKAFKETLLQHSDAVLQFRYSENKLVDAAYHITEIKQAPITSVDCGGVMNKWTEIVVQLWVPENEQQERSMKVSKALSIIDIVERMMPIDESAIVKIEFGNTDFDTRQMYPHKFLMEADELTIDLCSESVQCKALSRSGTCETGVTGNECCAPVTEKPLVQLVNLLVTTDSCCTPGTGCA